MAMTSSVDEIDRLIAEAGGLVDGDEPHDMPEAEPDGGVSGFPAINKDFQYLKQAMVNELVAPDLLPYEGEIVASIKDLLKHQEASLSGPAGSSLPGGATLHLYETDRVRYVIATYLRTRVHKIRKQLFALAATPPAQLRRLLSKEEVVLVHALVDAVGDHLTDEVSHALPVRFNANLEPGMATKPSLGTMVFVEAVVDIGEIAIPAAVEGGEPSSIQASGGDTFVLPYAIVQPLVQAGKMVLACDTRQLE